MRTSLIQQPGATLPFVTTYTAGSPFNEIPAMTDPLGRHWSQPADIREAPMDDDHVLLTVAQIDALPVYDRGYPSGCYDGKCWLRHGNGDVFWLCWYHPHPKPGTIGIGSREVLVIGEDHGV